MKAKKLLIILITIALIGFVTTFYFHMFYKNYEVREIGMKLEVAQKLGLNTDTDMLNFGANFPGNTCKRFMDISFPKRTRVFIGFEGDFAEWVSVDDNRFILEPNENKHLAFLTQIPKDALEGNYTGKAVFYFKRV